MASNQVDISRFGERGLVELVNQEQEYIDITSRIREVALKAGLALSLSRGFGVRAL